MVSKWAALVDIDLSRNKKTQLFSLGYRASFEYYEYANWEGGKGHPFFDLCLYFRPALRFNWFWINALGGLAYHTDYRKEESESELSPRIGLEFKFNVFRKYVAFLLKSSFSFQPESGFIGAGISLGYFN